MVIQEGVLKANSLFATSIYLHDIFNLCIIQCKLSTPVRFCSIFR